MKAAKLTKAAKVFRGVAGGVLPDSFWEPNAHGALVISSSSMPSTLSTPGSLGLDVGGPPRLVAGVRGGVESAFMSTTYDRSVAMHYASAPNKPAIVFEIQSACQPANRQPQRALLFNKRSSPPARCERA